MKVYTKIIWSSDNRELLADWFSYQGPLSLLNSGGGKTIEQGSQGPWTAQQPYLVRGFNEALANFESSRPQYFPRSTVTPFSPATQQGLSLMQGLAGSSQLPSQAGGELSRTMSGDYLGTPESWITRSLNPFMGGFSGGVSNPYLGGFSGGVSNPYLNSFNPYANERASVDRNPYESVSATVGQNPYLEQSPNAYINDLTGAISRSVIPSVQSRYGTSGRTGDSPIAQATMARSIADALAPYQFSSAEAEMGRRFAGGESLAGRIQSASEARAQRQFGAGESFANALRAAEADRAGRLYGAGQQFAGQQFAGGESLASREQQALENLFQRQFAGGESALNRGLSAYDAERARQMQALGMTPSLEGLRYSPADALLRAGALEERKAGETLQDEIARFNFEQNMPIQKLADYMATVGSMNFGQAGTNITDASYRQPLAQTFGQLGQGLGK